MKAPNISRSILTLLAVAMPVHAYEPERAMVNLSHEMAECGSYFMLTSQAPGLDKDTSAILEKKAAGLYEAAASISNEEVTTARAELALKTMAREMKSDWSNLSIINNKYGYLCIDLFDDPEARMNYWLEKKD